MPEQCCTCTSAKELHCTCYGTQTSCTSTLVSLPITSAKKQEDTHTQAQFKKKKTIGHPTAKYYSGARCSHYIHYNNIISR